MRSSHLGIKALVSAGLAVAGLTVAGCSRYEEQCQQAALGAKAAENAFIEMRNAAGVGDVVGVEKAKQEFDAAISKIRAIEIDGDGKEAGLRNLKNRVVAAAPEGAAVLQKLAAAVKADAGASRYPDGLVNLTARLSVLSTVSCR
jgi:hypothetical protein